jgi:hypothetical protein
MFDKILEEAFAGISDDINPRLLIANDDKGRKAATLECNSKITSWTHENTILSFHIVAATAAIDS